MSPALSLPKNIKKKEFRVVPKYFPPPPPKASHCSERRPWEEAGTFLLEGLHPLSRVAPTSVDVRSWGWAQVCITMALWVGLVVTGLSSGGI